MTVRPPLECLTPLPCNLNWYVNATDTMFCVLSRLNGLTLRWALGHRGLEVNKKVSQRAK